MFFGWITRIMVPTVEGIFLVKGVHIIVTIGLGQDTGRRDTQITRISLHDGGMGNIAIGLETVTVDYHISGTHYERIKRTVHRQY